MALRHLIIPAALSFAASTLTAQAEVWPFKPLRAVVPYAAGSTTDIVPRIVFEQLSAQLGQAIIVENRAGAGGTTGAAFVAKSEPDGYTLLVNSSAHTIAPSLYSHLSYHPAHDFASVAALGISPIVLVVPPSKGFKSAADFVAAAKAKPGAFNFSSVGVGTATHLSAEKFRFSANVDAVHVPFKGGSEAMVEVIADRIDFFFGPVGLVLSNIKAGKLSALAVNGATRSAALPEVPTTSEAGFANAEYPIWFGLFLPARTPRPIVEKLHAETMKALQSPTVLGKLAGLGIDPMPLSPKDFDALVAKGIAADAALVKAIGLKAK